jgi:hypothetical protein
VLAGLIGGIFFGVLVGSRVLSPTSVEWTLQLDWQHHFMGWHFFRNEPWHWPPGRIEGYFAPVGTSIGFTDSIPLAALALKPIAGLLPMPFQYLGLWLLLCFVLQGVMGALITSMWTPNAGLQIAGGCLFIVVPTLLGRVGHPALASHWLLLWAIWLYIRESYRPAPWFMFLSLGLIAGLIHPYLAAMTMLIVAALAVRRLIERGRGIATRVVTAAAPVVASGAGLLIGWWCSGLLSLSSGTDLASSGLTQYSMNLLGPFASAGWSRLIPRLTVASELQDFEGFQYFGVGIFLLLLCALVLAVWHRGLSWRASAPLLVAVVLSGIYALSPRITLGSRVLVDYTTPLMDQVSMFRATGRFFWPTTYALVTCALWLVVARLGARVAFGVLTAVIALQVTDLSEYYKFLWDTARSDQFHVRSFPLQDRRWHEVLPFYRQMHLYPPEHCGPAPLPLMQPAYLAGLYGLSINTGHVARVNRESIRLYCQQLGRDFDAGLFRDDSIYLLNPLLLDRFRQNAKQGVVCSILDNIPACVTAASQTRWKDPSGFQ